MHWVCRAAQKRPCSYQALGLQGRPYEALGLQALGLQGRPHEREDPAALNPKP
jgi:hypothetical protein